jgi:hypothetical protein
MQRRESIRTMKTDLGNLCWEFDSSSLPRPSADTHPAETHHARIGEYAQCPDCWSPRLFF